MQALKLVEKEVSITAPWGQIKGITWGSLSNPPVLLVHGVSDSCSSFRPLVSMLPNKYFYVSIDLPGNGRSDHLPKGIRYSVMDLLPTLKTVREHFNWDKFGFIGHSLGCVLGKYFSIIYPDYITRTVELDPLPAYQIITPKEFENWYRGCYGRYYEAGNYKRFNDPDAGQKVTYEKAREMLMEARGLTEEQAKNILERCLTPTSGELFRFTFDPRNRVFNIPLMPLPLEYCKELYTSVKTPILTMFARELVEMRAYDNAPFALNEKEWPNGNYNYKIIDGAHDFFLTSPESISDDISKFLLESDASSKL